MNLLNLLEHNPRHFTEVKILGEQYQFCSRCLGMYSVGVISFILLGIAHLYISLDFWEVIIVSWLLASVCIADWILTKTRYWKGNNKSRIISGASLGIATSFYFWLLPIDWLPKIASLLLFETVFGILIFLVNYREMKLGLFEISDKFQNKLANKIFCCDCGCCSTVCCLGKMMCWIALIGCCCCCPILIILLLFYKK